MKAALAFLYHTIIISNPCFFSMISSDDPRSALNHIYCRHRPLVPQKRICIFSCCCRRTTLGEQCRDVCITRIHQGVVRSIVLYSSPFYGFESEPSTDRDLFHQSRSFFSRSSREMVCGYNYIKFSSVTGSI